MFDRPGIGIDDLAWIRRDQYVHYTTLAHQLGDPHDWPRFRHDLADAITAAFWTSPVQPDTSDERMSAWDSKTGSERDGSSRTSSSVTRSRW